MLLKFFEDARKVIFVCAVLFSSIALSAPKFYLQTQGGLSSLGLSQSNASKIEFRGNTYTWRVSGGALWGSCTPWQYGVEAGFMDFPRLYHYTDDYGIIDRPVHESATLNGYSVDLLGVAKYNVNTKFNVLAKLGAACLNFSEEDFTRFIDDGSTYSRFHRNDHIVAPEAALGIGYKLKQNLEINLGVNAIFTDRPDDDTSITTNVFRRTTVAGLTAGIVYYFS